MALIARIACRNHLLLRQLQPCLAGRVKHASSWKDDQAKFWEKNLQGNRPMSPHLTAFRLPLPAWLSVTHRGTGIALYGGAVAFGIGITALPGDYTTYLAAIQAWQYGPQLLFLTKFYLTWPFVFHSLNGCRHMAWDLGYGLYMKALYTTGIAVLGTSVAIAAGISLL